MRRATLTAWGLGLAVLAAACSGDGAAETSTTQPATTAAPVTSLEPPASTTTTTTAAPPSTTVTTTTEAVPAIVFPDYTIVSLEEGEAGNTVVVLLDPQSYDSLTDIDLANVLADVVERFPPILTAFVIDSPSVADSVLLDDPTAEELELLSRHYLVRLEEGFRMVFAGPFEGTPIAILGS